ncbi:helix-turn-helix domain-containing protein [Bacillus infantis]|uniref:Helix-turn-helix domain-containing protein n=1 Tax=Bacillus infantis TaxID=324767 RepID=A0A5D4SIW0_9BACI|nr:helix-turn-helix domain-containing protein [Bacillus infantis]MCK6208150.1 helix-turn-helix domain-containing protein [Bacillus infantis]OXT15039.1 transcriptional regulator [Bacillus sp. OG2]TYS62042.1 helix-turn-helix domain-containing protein [Bacillus infantis]
MVGGRIKRLRLLRGFSINELAEKSGVSKSYLSYIERDIQKNPSLQVLSKLAKTLGTSVEELLDYRIKPDVKTAELDPEWQELVQEAIDQGITKEDFSYYLDFIRFKNTHGGNDGK